MAQATAHPLPPRLAEAIARRFGALAEPMRLRLLDVLRERGEASVQELAIAVDATHANASKHLGVLHTAGIVARRKQGSRALYRIADPVVFRLCDEVCGGIREQVAELGELLDGDPGHVADTEAVPA